jgi:hypothetical protein
MIQDSEFSEELDLAISAGDLDRAFELYERIIVSPEFKKPLEKKADFALLLWNCYEFECAQTFFEELMLESSTPLVTLQQIAKSYFQTGRFRAAAEVMQIAVNRSPREPELLTQLASCLERTNDLSGAVSAAEAALRILPSCRPAVRQLARIERREGEFYKAISRLTDHLLRFPEGDTWLLRYELAANLDRIEAYGQAWQELLLAKNQFQLQSQRDLELSYSIRRRQGELVKLITDAELRRWHQAPIGDPRSLVLLAGFPRSGTTLLESILTSRSDVIGTDETGILCSQFIRPIVWEAKTAQTAYSEICDFEMDQIQAGRKTYFKFTSSVIGEEIGNRCLIEKDPLLTCDLPLPLRLFPDAKLIMPLRDPRDVVISYFFTMLPMNWNSVPAINIVECARFYHDIMRHWLVLRSRLPCPTLEFRYEDFIKAPQLECQRLCNFMQIDYQSSMFDPQSRSAQKWITTPTYDDISRPIYDRSISRWRNYQPHLEPVLEILNPWAKEFGYE